MSVGEHAPAKVNLVLQVGPRGGDGLHELCSLFASIELEDRVELHPAPDGDDAVICPGVEGENLASRALRLFREAAPDAELGPVQVEIDKAIPVAAGLGGGSADAAAVLRAANRLAGHPLSGQDLLALAVRLGSDVPSQLRPGHAIVTGGGELVEPVALQAIDLVLLPQEQGLATAEVYGELDRLRAAGELTAPAALDPEPLRELARHTGLQLATALENDLEAAALSLRPELADGLAALEQLGALAARVTGSGPTLFGVFASASEADAAARELPGAIATRTR
ncbi:MAG TPA: 4-(cytidine 5'-diphospho)-2-C-methyl-D-erythritol kinase [Thermoleophilaceae bacterium]|nr:4-(cytidine 5'-diphospho)-2-C-methyl-D-erythritol kinase [Thermoleophilaceae bacterium]